MPAFSTHYIFAYEMMDYLRESADFQLNSDAVYFGTQGPDIFFFHRAMPWMAGKSLRSYGSELHRQKPEILLTAMREYCEASEKQDIAKSYVYGFILHYSLDRICHPYVYFLQNRITEKSRLANPHTVHNTIEFAMDSYLLRRRLNISKPAAFDTAATVSSNPEVIAEISRLLTFVICRTIGRAITEKQCKTAMLDLKYIQKLCLDRSFAKHLLIYPIEAVAAPFSKNFKFSAMLRPRDLEKAEKYANINKRIWQAPLVSKNRNESFEELFELAKADAKELISGYQAGKNCRELTKNISFLTGVEVE